MKRHAHIFSSQLMVVWFILLSIFFLLVFFPFFFSSSMLNCRSPLNPATLICNHRLLWERISRTDVLKYPSKQKNGIIEIASAPEPSGYIANKYLFSSLVGKKLRRYNWSLLFQKNDKRKLKKRVPT